MMVCKMAVKAEKMVVKMVSLMVDLMAVWSASKRVRYSVASTDDLMVCKMAVKMAVKMADLMVV